MATCFFGSVFRFYIQYIIQHYIQKQRFGPWLKPLSFLFNSKFQLRLKKYWNWALYVTETCSIILTVNPFPQSLPVSIGASDPNAMMAPFIVFNGIDNKVLFIFVLYNNQVSSLLYTVFSGISPGLFWLYKLDASVFIREQIVPRNIGWAFSVVSWKRQVNSFQNLIHVRTGHMSRGREFCKLKAEQIHRKLVSFWDIYIFSCRS